MYDSGHAVRVELQTGVRDDKSIEVTNYQFRPGPARSERWVPFDGSEKVILGDLSILADGSPVVVAPGTEGTELAGATPAPIATTRSAATAGPKANAPPASSSVELSNGHPGKPGSKL